MGPFVNLLFVVSWSAVVFALVFAITRRYAPQSSAPFAAFIASLAFAAGAFASPMRHPVPPVAFGSSAGARSAHDVSELCSATYAPAAPGAGGAGNVDIVADAVTKRPLPTSGSLPGDHGLVVAGWAANAARSGPARGVCPELDGKPIDRVTAIYGQPRPDVAAATQSATLVASGFTIEIPAQSVPGGVHTLRIRVLSGDDRSSQLGAAYTVRHQ